MKVAAIFFGAVILIAGLVPAIVAVLKGEPIQKAITLGAIIVGGLIVWAGGMFTAGAEGPAAALMAESQSNTESEGTNES